MESLYNIVLCWCKKKCNGYFNACHKSSGQSWCISGRYIKVLKKSFAHDNFWTFWKRTARIFQQN